MSRGGRGRGGQSGGSRGGRGSSRGGGSSWPGEGRRLGEGEPSTRGNGRGRGRGGPVRGMGFRVNAQNAVGYDYGTPLQSGQQTPEEQVVISDADASNDDDDIVLETHRKYTHIVKPHMEQEDVPQRYTATNDAGPSMMLPPSVSNLNARSASNLVAMERAQRAMEGQVAGLIPTGPKSAHVHRMYGTLDAVHQRNRNRHQEKQQYPLPVSTGANDKKKKGNFDRPAENTAGDPCMAGIPRSTPRREMPSNFNFLGKGGSGNLQLPVKFEKASGEWRDGAWVRVADGKELATVESVREAAQETAQPSDPFERASGAGLGFHSAKQAAPMEDDVWAMEREQHDEESDPIAALLKSHPGSKEMQEDEGGNNESFGYYQGSMGLLQANNTTDRVVKDQTDIDSVVEDTKPANDTPVQQEKDEAMDDSVSDDEEIILIPQTQGAEGTSRMVESDSEEERQLDAIIEQSRIVAEAAPPVEQKEAGFFVDLTGEAEQGEAGVISYEVTSSTIIGEPSVTKVVDTEMIVEDSEEDVEIKQSLKQPKAGGKKARNAAKKARRRAKGRNNLESEPLVAREGDSDLEWGSDGPPVQFRKKADQDTFVQGGSMQQLSLNVLPTPHSKDEEDEMMAVALANSIESNQKSTKGKKPATSQSLKEAIIQDYMENAMGVEDVDVGEEDGNVVTEKRDEKKVNKKTELDALLQFMNGMDGQRQGKEMTLEDIAIEQQMQEEDEWMTEDSADEEEESDGKDYDAAVNKEERKALPNESADDSDSDESDSSEDAKPRKQKKETWSDSDDSDSDDDDDDFDRHFSWADADEAFIQRIGKFANANESILKGRDRKARNRLFKMIETGNFDNLDEEDMIIDNDDPVFGRGALQPVKGGKKAKKTWGENHVFAEQLESQWQKDRAQKADNKRKRAAERAAAAENPYHGTQIKKGTKKMAKKAARAERRANKQNGGRVLVDEDDFEEDSGENMRHATNLFELDKQIQLFLRDTSKTTLSLSPMDKRARAQVHLLANCYNLTSKSIGNGSKRFPTLIKNQRSGFNVNFAKVNSVLNGTRGSFGSGYKARDSNGVKVKDRASGVGAHVPKNQEGAAVGFGADRIGEENIGHRLLTMMGWSEGFGVGKTQGAAEPVGATIKVTKSGLGF